MIHKVAKYIIVSILLLEKNKFKYFFQSHKMNLFWKQEFLANDSVLY